VPLFVGPKQRLAQGSAELPFELTSRAELSAAGSSGGVPIPRPELSAVGNRCGSPTPTPGFPPPLNLAGASVLGAYWWYTDAYEYYSGAWHYTGRIQNPNYSNVVNAGNNWVAGNPGYRTYSPDPPQQIYVP